MIKKALNNKLSAFFILELLTGLARSKSDEAVDN